MGGAISSHHHKHKQKVVCCADRSSYLHTVHSYLVGVATDKIHVSTRLHLHRQRLELEENRRERVELRLGKGVRVSSAVRLPRRTLESSFEP